jgi:2-C-methyl-D-erythritol 4-phosphate cytidylyltransferase/2-C-methyl-D-erythritol 2,4-cyclodiphosphate synthase
MRIAAVIVAAGSGDRAGGEKPKQFQDIGGKPVLYHSLETFSEHPEIGRVQAVIGPTQQNLFRDSAGHLDVPPPVIGGTTRQASCRNGIEALAEWGPSHVLIHDAARPFVSAQLIDCVIEGLKNHSGVIPGLPVSETLKRAPQGRIRDTVDRQDLWVAQTPQGFSYDAIRDAHRRAHREGKETFTDDAAVAANAGMEVAMIMGAPENRKLTTRSDIIAADEIISRREHEMLSDVRTAQGIDFHAFAPGDHVMLCGVRIPHSHKLDGHSDADAALHALTDAVLGALGESDIGTHFPPGDARWKDAASTVFLSKACELLKGRRGQLANVDITILCEAPRIAPHVAAMKSKLAQQLQIDSGRIAIKATTTERLGFIGRGEGLAAFATVTVRLPG